MQTTPRPEVVSFFDEATHTIMHIVTDPATKHAAIIDSILDYDAASGALSYRSAQRIIDHVREHELVVDWLLETHVHADHLSAAPYLQERLGGKLAIGRNICGVQETFGRVFNAGTEFARDGSQFDRLWDDGDEFSVGSLSAKVIATPGHTPADVSYRIGDAVFVGDTLFAPDYGAARCDFPGGSAEALFDSAHKLFALPDETRVFLCHDYLPAGRTDYLWETTIGRQKRENIQLNTAVSRPQFVQARQERDRALGMPALIIPSLQVNMRAGHLPEPEANGERYLKIPIDGPFARRPQR